MREYDSTLEKLSRLHAKTNPRPKGMSLWQEQCITRLMDTVLSGNTLDPVELQEVGELYDQLEHLIL